MIKENLKLIRKKIKETCENMGKNGDSVTLIAVSKTFAIDKIEEAVEEGQVVFGENKVQEFKTKREYFEQKKHVELKWHLIGPLQKNKAKIVAKYADLFHCLDSLKLAERLNRLCGEEGRVLPVLVQVNSSGEASKSGVTPQELPEFIKSLANLENLKISGLMSIGLFHADPEESRSEFRMMKTLFDNTSEMINQKNCDFKFLSMGMSNDFQIAIEEGANLVRVGSSIFGNRHYDI